MCQGQQPVSVGIIAPLTYRWFANKVVYYNPLGYKYLNATSTKIYLTYEAPLETQPRVLALDKICAYARNEYQPAGIAEKGVSGVYAERWNYDPGQFISGDHLYTIRNRIGQCGDYANLLTCLYRTIGLTANSVIIFNGARFSGIDYLLFWHLTGRPSRDLGVLLSEDLRACDGQSEEWYFTYHAVSSSANTLCDAALGQFRVRSDYNGYWQYYLHPPVDTTQGIPYSHDEPPPFPPSYYDWQYYIPPGPQSVLPGYTPYETKFDHPGP